MVCSWSKRFRAAVMLPDKLTGLGERTTPPLSCVREVLVVCSWLQAFQGGHNAAGQAEEPG